MKRYPKDHQQSLAAECTILCAKCGKDITHDDQIYFKPGDTESDNLFCVNCRSLSSFSS